MFDADYLAARYTAVQRSMNMIEEANQIRSAGDFDEWDWDKLRAIRAFREYPRRRLAKIQRAVARRSVRLRYLSLRDHYAQQTDPAYANITNADFVQFGWGGVTAGGAAWGEHSGDWLVSWGQQDSWPPSNPALNDPGFWLTEERDKISPFLIPHSSTSNVTIVPLEL
ncbi:hypothetical protein R3P38DRAFT_2788184 [Favolaschia claudopus]|uniref:Uncharacterized protein n=1 Tax=Favolaschia claudopus TaxID=2862362 RepID=A0AAW0AL69_9AGAR